MQGDLFRAPAFISDIVPESADSWRQRWFLTIDVDWAPDEVAADTLELLIDHNVPSTWMVTHSSPWVHEILRRTQLAEVGIHPNFNPLLDNSALDSGTNTETVLSELCEAVPEATSVRSHSVVQSSRLMEAFMTSGMTHEVNTFVPAFAEATVEPWRHWNGLVGVPFSWSDDVSCLYAAAGRSLQDPGQLVKGSPGIVVVNFHPIHVFLNTETIKRYEETRDVHHKPSELIRHRYAGYGTRDRFIDLLNCAC